MELPIRDLHGAVTMVTSEISCGGHEEDHVITLTYQRLAGLVSR